jgi:hypothetical protein
MRLDTTTASDGQLEITSADQIIASAASGMGFASPGTASINLTSGGAATSDPNTSSILVWGNEGIGLEANDGYITMQASGTGVPPAGAIRMISLSEAVTMQAGSLLSTDPGVANVTVGYASFGGQVEITSNGPGGQISLAANGPTNPVMTLSCGNSSVTGHANAVTIQGDHGVYLHDVYATQADTQNVNIISDKNNISILAGNTGGGGKILIGTMSGAIGSSIQIGGQSTSSPYPGSTTNNVFLCSSSADKLSFFGSAVAAPKQVITGAKGGNAALASLLTALATYGLLQDSSTA